MPRQNLFPVDGDMETLYAFGRSLEEIQQQEIGPLARSIYGAQAREAISVNKIPKNGHTHAGTFLHVTIRMIADGDTVRSYAFSETGGTVNRAGVPSEHVDRWETLVRLIYNDISNVCVTPLRAIVRLSELGESLKPQRWRRKARRRPTTHIHAVL